MKQLVKLTLCASALALAMGSAFAADKDHSSTTVGKAGNVTRSEDSTFAKLDKNKDGYISKAEAAGDMHLSKDFAKFDLNNDGKLNRAEYLAAAAKEDTGKAIDKVTSKDKDKAPASSGSSTKTK